MWSLMDVVQAELIQVRHLYCLPVPSSFGGQSHVVYLQLLLVP